MTSPIKRKRPISRKFWSYLIYLPQPIRAMLIRSKFKIDYDLPDELVLKQAETTDEITQALRIVYDSYMDLNYIDANAAKLRLTKYHALSTTVILIAKCNDEVVGTLSIIPDTALGLPCELTYNIDKYKNQGQQIAEISALSIKKDYRKRRGQLLLPLCKIMYQFCTQVLQLDGVIVSTLPDVEPFYTDVLLFEKISTNTEKENIYVKGTPTTCCYLPLNQNTIDKYQKTYGNKKKIFNLYEFFVKENTANIQLPDFKKCLQAYTNKQNISLSEILKLHPSLTENYTEKDKIILKNLDIANTLFLDLNDTTSRPDRAHKRYQIKQYAWLFEAEKKTPSPIHIIDVSENGIKILLAENLTPIKKHTKILIFFGSENNIIQLNAEVSWVKNNRILGCQITSSTDEWHKFAKTIFDELDLSSNIFPFKIKKIA